MKLMVYLEADYISNETIGDSVTNINEAGKVALEMALQEQDKGNANVTAVIVGSDVDDVVLREAYAMGVDNLVHVINKDNIVGAVADFVKTNGYDAVITAVTNVEELAKGLDFQVVEDVVKAGCVTHVKGSEIKPRYMHIARVFRAYEQPVEQV